MRHYFMDDPTLPDDFREFFYYFAGQKIQLISNSGVFSPGHVDPATDLLLRLLPPVTGRLLDLGCGYGAIGVALAKAYGLQAPVFADVNARAIACARRNCAANGIEGLFALSDGFAEIPGQFDCITLNPPIHAGKAVVYALFAGAAERLASGGRFYIVMLEKHGAESARARLGELFQTVETLHKKKGYWVGVCDQAEVNGEA
ncbi:MAG: methyltransferase [Oscillospiraceae bacterium]|jgi:16S rRNA (guanine1207-N2)-methyltransferase|nr:methyltransferase [Oscillospiraceae bacterium]